MNLLEKMEGPLTVALTGPYGYGKSDFLTRCKIMLEGRGVSVILLNAWETDFASDPLAPLISELTAKFASKIPGDKQTIRNVKSYAAKIAVAAVPIGVKLFTAGILRADDFTETALSDTAQKFAEAQFQRFEAAKESIQRLREELATLAGHIRFGKSDPDHKAPPPVIVMIDELDRCRPTYSIELLELIKHLFSIPGIIGPSPFPLREAHLFHGSL